MTKLSFPLWSILNRPSLNRPARRRNAGGRHKLTCHFESLEERQVLSTFVGSGTNPATSTLLAAKVEFSKINTNDLQIILTNTTTALTKAPSDLLTGVYFDIAGTPTLTRGGAKLATGSTILNAPAFADDGTTPLIGGTVNGNGEVGGEFAYK